MNSVSIHQPTIGILGGASNVATGHIYARINAISNSRLNPKEGGLHIVQTLIAGMDFGVIERGVRMDDWSMLSDYVGLHLDRLAAADLIICVSNTLHKVVVPLMENRNQKFLHIVDPTAAAIRAAGLSRVALFGTKPIMSADYAIARYLAAGVDIVVPSEVEQLDVDRIIFDELCRFDIRLSSRERYVEIAQRLVREAGAEGLILGCTEIESLLSPDDLPNLPLFDTMERLCQAAVDAVLGPADP